MTSCRQRLQPEQHNDTNLYSSHNVSEAFYNFDSMLINDHEMVETQEHISMEPSSLCPSIHNSNNLELGLCPFLAENRIVSSLNLQS